MTTFCSRHVALYLDVTGIPINICVDGKYILFCISGNSFYSCLVPVIQVLERKEWKNFRALVSSKPQLRRCGKRLPRYCDVNNDRKISITEWLNCLSTQRTNTGESHARNLVINHMLFTLFCQRNCYL